MWIRAASMPSTSGRCLPSWPPWFIPARMIEEMAIEAALTGNARLVMQAILHDPLTAAVLSLAEIRSMVAQMFHQNRDYLGYFKTLQV